MPPDLNNTFLCFTPIGDALELACQSRPIGLCNVIYKIIGKCIVNRIKPMMPHLNSCTQTRFVSGRQITDNNVIVQEIIYTMRIKQGMKGSIMAIRIDFVKGYDRLWL